MRYEESINARDVDLRLAEQREDMVNQPPHYTESGVEPMDVIEAWKLPHHLACVVKYICRYQHKGGRTDLMKAEWYLKRYLSLEEDG